MRGIFRISPRKNSRGIGPIPPRRNSSREILRAKYGWLDMDDSFEFSHSFAFGLSRIDMYSIAKQNLFLRNLIFSRAKIFAFRREKLVVESSLKTANLYGETCSFN